MLEDEDYLDAVQNIIDTQKVNAEYAVAVTGDNFAQMFAAMEDEYMRGRAADVKDISERIVRVLSGGAGQGIHTDEPVIILADDLAPSETVQLEKDKVLSFGDGTRFRQFPHGDPGAYDEHSGADRNGRGAR